MALNSKKHKHDWRIVHAAAMEPWHHGYAYVNVQMGCFTPRCGAIRVIRIDAEKLERKARRGDGPGK